MLEPSDPALARSLSAAPPDVLSRRAREVINFFMSGVRRVADGLVPAAEVTAGDAGRGRLLRHAA